MKPTLHIRVYHKMNAIISTRIPISANVEIYTYVDAVYNNTANIGCSTRETLKRNLIAIRRTNYTLEEENCHRESNTEYLETENERVYRYIFWNLFRIYNTGVISRGFYKLMGVSF